MRIDVNAFVGSYPFRRVPGTSPDALLAAMDRVGIDQAWVTHLPGVFWRDPDRRQRLAARDRPPRAAPPAGAGGASGAGRLARRAGARPRDAGAPAVRADPTFYGIDPAGPGACARSRPRAARPGFRSCSRCGSRTAASGTPTITPPSFPRPRCARSIRSDPRVRLLVTHADRPFIEEVHFGSTPDGGVADLVGHLLDLGAAGGPSRRPCSARSAPRASCSAPASRSGFRRTRARKLDLLDLSAADRAAIESGNARA